MITVKNLCKEYKVLKKEESKKNAIKHIFKREYEVKQVVNNLSFHISQGEIVGFIGPNGAGKSTTINMLTGILLPTRGIVRVNGMDPYKNHIKNVKQIGAVFGHRTQLWKEMPVIESFQMMKHMYKISDKQYKENMQLFCDILDLDNILYKPVDKLSLGQRMRADFACANLHNPKILYLDEPTIGLDVIAKESILNFIYEVNKLRKTTVILTTHNVTDIEKICSRVMVIDKGGMVYNGDIKRMKAVFALEHTMQLEIDNMRFPDLEDLPIKKYKIEKNGISITYDNKIINSSIILNHIVKQCHIKSIKMYEPNLNDIVRAMYEKIPAQSIQRGGNNGETINSS
ncbi:MAG: ABC transporter ATP-binding protein [Clostridium sp.]|uniref:ABC transporter ATP-binding protein n=1 Tax=Clostridium sp. TaxID=1506 RepID=UPI003D6C99FE